MEVTRITPENAEYFEELAPEGSLTDEGPLWLGAIAEDGTACAVLGGSAYEEMAFINWIYTACEYREKGAASSLLKAFSSLLNKIGSKIIEVGFSEEIQELSEFLEAEGFLISDDSDRYSVPLADLIYSETVERSEEGRDPSIQIKKRRLTGSA